MRRQRRSTLIAVLICPLPAARTAAYTTGDRPRRSGEDWVKLYEPTARSKAIRGFPNAFAGHELVRQLAARGGDGAGTGTWIRTGTGPARARSGAKGKQDTHTGSARLGGSRSREKPRPSGRHIRRLSTACEAGFRKLAVPGQRPVG